MSPETVSIELELSQEGYSRLCRLADRAARAGANPSLSNIVAVAVTSGIEALEKLMDMSERERRIGRTMGGRPL